jgi:hypothetical protein
VNAQLHQGNCYNGSIGSVLVFVGGMIFDFLTYYHISNNIGGVMVSVLASSTVDSGFKPRSGQSKDYKIGICC